MKRPSNIRRRLALLAAGASALTLTSSALAELKVVSLFPANGATNVCADTPLRITFDAPAQSARTGRILIRAVSGAMVDRIDLAERAHTTTLCGATFTNRALLFGGNSVTICPRAGVLANGQSYYVTIEAGALTGPAGDAFPGFAEADSWRFTTKTAGPPADTNLLVVAADGSGDFCTVQGAVESVPPGNRSPIDIQIRNGTYEEIVYVTNRNSLTFRGEDRKRTIIAYANNERLNYRGLKLNIYRQAFGVNADDITIEHLTLRNLTPQGGSQAEALRIDGQHCVVRDADFYSYQDTLKLSGTVFVSNCYVEGDVDFIWGFGTCYFTNCEIKCLRRGGYLTQIRNDADHYGDVFVDCRLTKGPGVSNCVLSRIEVNRFPHSHVAYINCRMDDHIRPEGWMYTRGTNSPADLRFWEYRSTDLTGTNRVDVSRREDFSRQLTAAEAVRMRDPKVVFDGWSP
jgi:pectin methylesterase-like acyl-CoA thioesterase